MSDLTSLYLPSIRFYTFHFLILFHCTAKAFYTAQSLPDLSSQPPPTVKYIQGQDGVLL